MLFLAFLVAVLNLALGFGIAVYLGRRYRGSIGSEDRWATDTAFGSLAPHAVPTAPEDTATASSSAGQATDPQGVAPATKTVAAEGPLTAGTEVFDESRPPQPVQEPQPEVNPDPRCVESLMAAVSQYGEQLARADDQLRSCAGKADSAAIEACLISLKQATESYLRRRGEAHQQYTASYRLQPAFGSVSDDIQAAIERQDARINSAYAALGALDPEEDLQNGCRQMLGETGRLIDENNRLRDSVSAAIAAVARNERGRQHVHPATHIDALTGLLSRAGLEAELLARWRDAPEESQPFSVVMVDVDHLAGVNKQYGHRVGDAILCAIAEVLKSGRRKQNSVARFSGQRFLALLDNVDARAATNVAEQIRQTMEMARFQHRGGEIRVTVSCAVTEATADDTPERLIARTEAALQEAKRYGRNRTFLDEASYPTPVVPPSMSIDEKSLAL